MLWHVGMLLHVLLQQKLPWRERKQLLRKKRRSSKVERRPARGSGASNAVPRSVEENPTTSPRKRPRRQGTEGVLHAKPELTKEPTCKVCPNTLLSSCPDVYCAYPIT